MASGGYWLCFTNIKVFFLCPCGHRRNFWIFAQNTISPFFFPPLFANNAHFQLLLFANLDLNTFFASFVLYVRGLCIFALANKELGSINLFVPLSWFCQLFQLSFRLIMQRQVGWASLFSLQNHSIWMRSRKVNRVVWCLTLYKSAISSIMYPNWSLL